jgi:ribosomal protein L29
LKKTTYKPLAVKGFEKNGDEILTERFNPLNAELNKKRFKKQHGHVINARKGRGTKGAQVTFSSTNTDIGSDGASKETLSQD